MNKLFALLCAFALFGSAFVGFAAENQTPGQNPTVNTEVKETKKEEISTEIKTEEKKEAKSEDASYWKSFKDFYGKHKTAIRWGSAAIAAVYVGHKVMYHYCPEYKNWVDGTDNGDDEAKSLPWTN